MMLARRNLAMPSHAELRRELDRVFDGFLGPQANPMRSRAYPALNVWESDERLMVEAEVPGLNMDDLDITIQGNELTIKGRRQSLEGENLVYHRRERGTGEFTRFMTLPFDVDADRVEAALKDGVLMIILPKSEQARARKITVKSA